MSASSSRRGVWIALGAVFIVGGLVAAVLLWNGASQRRNSAIENFARAPIGCDTTLDFIEPGEYLLFVETVGNLDGVRGDCGVEGAYDNADQGDPDVEITLVDPDGVDVDLDRSFGDVEYDAAGFRGAARFSVDIEETDDHVLRAESEVDEVFVVAVGRDPNEGVTPLRTGAIAAGLIGLLAGLALVLLGARKSSATIPAGPWMPGVASQPGAFMPGGTVPQGPPVYGQQGGPPQYARQPPPPQQQYGQPGQYGQAAPPAYGPPGAPQPGAPQPGAPQPGAPQPGAPQPGVPQYGQQPYPQQQRYPQQQPPAPAPPQPAPPQFQQYPAGQPSIPGQPNIPGQPTFPQAPADSAGSAQTTDWAPQSPLPPAPNPYPSETAPPDADFLAQLREERSTRERPPPPPPE